jgi:hypothetical protein
MALQDFAGRHGQADINFAIGDPPANNQLFPGFRQAARMVPDYPERAGKPFLIWVIHRTSSGALIRIVAGKPGEQPGFSGRRSIRRDARLR